MPLVQTRGAASAQGFGEFAQATAAIPYIEDVFSTFLYTGTGATQTITNNIDLSTKGGLVWVKYRNIVSNHYLVDTVRGASNTLASNQTFGQYSDTTVTGFNASGFTVGAGASSSGDTLVSWTFREQPKFFDVVTYTGDAANRTIAHSLGSVPGSIIVKRTDTTADWAVYHRSLANTEYLVLNTFAAKATGATWWNSTTPTSAVFSVGTDASVNASGGTYVAYLFAHDAGGFGLEGTDNVISCGSYTTDGSGNATVSLGYEPQWLLWKPASDSGNWQMVDNMRGWVSGGSGTARLFPNTSGVEVTTSIISGVNATGFNIYNASASSTQIYIAIRRGPMKVPTSGTSVFSPQAYTGTGAARTIDTSQPYLDSYIVRRLPGSGDNTNWLGRLTGSNALQTNADNAEGSIGSINWASQDLAFTGANYNTNNSSQNYVAWTFARAPSFFDEVCYTGTGSATTFSHNLGVVPELMIVKKRNAAGTDWNVYSSALGATKTFYLNQPDAAVTSSGAWNDTAPTSSVFTVGTSGTVNASAATYVAYLFATCAGVSKVGSYTGNGSTQTIDCGFGAGGARFVLIKRTDSTGGWYVYDTARGMTVLTDPYLLLNSTDAESATLGSVTTVSTGFALNSTILAAINASGGSFIFLAIS